MWRTTCMVIAAVGLTGLVLEAPADGVDASRELRTLDDRLAAVTARAGSFGGMYVDEASKTLFVYMTQPAAPERALDAVRVEFLDDELSFVQDIRVLRAQFSMQELLGWYERRGEVLAIDGVVFTDLNEGKNRIEVGVASDEAETAVAAALERLGVPREAVVLTHTEPIRLFSSLRTRHRPLVGGLEIRFSTSDGVFICTYGFAARRQAKNGYLTNSHCSETYLGLDFTKHFQPLRSPNNRIGQERIDPQGFAGGQCPSGRRCRFSDAAWGIRATGVPIRQKFARPPIDSINWNGTDKYRITSKGGAPQGLWLNKVGRTTGRTGGQVTNTCVNANVLDTNVTLLCQNVVEANGGPGDSGSPVVRVTNDPAQHDVRLVGILWGGGEGFYLYSPMSGIQDELGFLGVCAPGFGC